MINRIIQYALIAKVSEAFSSKIHTHHPNIPLSLITHSLNKKILTDPTHSLARIPKQHISFAQKDDHQSKMILENI